MSKEAIATKKGKKPYSRPALVVLDAATAKEKLKAKGDPNDAVVRKMLAFEPKHPKT